MQAVMHYVLSNHLNPEIISNSIILFENLKLICYKELNFKNENKLIIIHCTEAQVSRNTYKYTSVCEGSDLCFLMHFFFHKKKTKVCIKG